MATDEVTSNELGKNSTEPDVQGSEPKKKLSKEEKIAVLEEQKKRLEEQKKRARQRIKEITRKQNQLTEGTPKEKRARDNARKYFLGGYLLMAAKKGEPHAKDFIAKALKTLERPSDIAAFQDDVFKELEKSFK